MGRIRLLTVGLALLIVGGAVAGPSAFGGVPEFRLCKKYPGAPTHNYTAASCAPASFAGGSGKWEREPVPPGSTLTGKGLGPARKDVLAPVRPPLNPARVEVITECKRETVAGDITSATTEALVIKYTKCEAAAKRCHSPGASSGRIDTKPLEGVLVYLDAAHTAVGVRFKPTAGTVLAEYSCGAVTIKEEGEIIDEQTADIETAAKMFRGTFAEGPLKAQRWPYVEQQGTEENELEYAEWEVPILEGGQAGSPALGWNGSTFVPAYMNAVITGTSFTEGPSTQNAQTEYRGPAMLVEL